MLATRREAEQRVVGGDSVDLGFRQSESKANFLQVGGFQETARRAMLRFMEDQKDPVTEKHARQYTFWPGPCQKMSLSPIVTSSRSFYSIPALEGRR